MRAITEAGIAVLLHENGTWSREEVGTTSSREGFRKASWGSSRDQVKASEAQEPNQEAEDYLEFEVRLGRFSCLAVFIFVGDQLVRGKYLLIDEYQNRTNYLTAYDELKDSVTKKYGSASEDKTYWLDDLYKDNYSEWGMAVACGHFSRFANWETPESSINVALYGENFDVTVSVEYAGKAFAGIEESLKEAELLGDL